MPLKKNNGGLPPSTPGYVCPDGPYTKDIPVPAKTYIPGVNPLNPNPYPDGNGVPKSGPGEKYGDKPYTDQ